jgi:hypothetical protein
MDTIQAINMVLELINETDTNTAIKDVLDIILAPFYGWRN